MSRLKHVTACALAVCGLGALALPALAQAHEYKIEGLAVTGSAAVAGTVDRVDVRGTPFGVATNLECVHGSMTGTIEAAGHGKALISMRECAVLKPAGCELPELRFGGLGTTLEGTPMAESFVPSEGPLTEFTYQGGHCSLTGHPMKMEGSFSCSFWYVGEEAETHEVVCNIEGSHVKMGGKAATVEASLPSVHLVNGAGEPTKQKWSAS